MLCHSGENNERRVVDRNKNCLFRLLVCVAFIDQLIRDTLILPNHIKIVHDEKGITNKASSLIFIIVNFITYYLHSILRALTVVLF